MEVMKINIPLDWLQTKTSVREQEWRYVCERGKQQEQWVSTGTVLSKRCTVCGPISAISIRGQTNIIR